MEMILLDKTYIKQIIIKSSLVAVLATAVVSGTYEYYSKFINTHTDNDNKCSESISLVNSKPITNSQACEIVKRLVQDKNEKTRFVFDHEELKNGVQYFVIHGFDALEDHIATSGWYFVDKVTENVYQWDLNTDKLILVK